MNGCRSKTVRISVSLIGISISLIPKKLKNQSCQTFERIYRNAPILFSHPLRKVHCVIGRKETCQVAYITRESSALKNVENVVEPTKRKQCHVFRVETAFEVEEIETVLRNAFQRNAVLASAKNRLQTCQNIRSSRNLTTFSCYGSAINLKSNPYFPTEQIFDVTPKHLHSSKTTTALPLDAHTPAAKKPAFRLGFSSSKSKKQLTQSGRSSAFFQRIFGTTSNIDASNTTMETPLKWHDSKYSSVRFRKQFNSESMNEETPSKQLQEKSTRKRRPVSTVFGHSMLQRISTATGIGRNSECRIGNMVSSGVLPFNDQKNSSNFFTPVQGANKNTNARPHSTPITTKVLRETDEADKSKKQLSLVFDEKIKEWIYPIDECFLEELNKLAYFCRNGNREQIIGKLSQMPVGSFVLRLSGSRKQCLALTVRIPDDKENVELNKNVSHYLIIRNQHGFRIKHYFSSLPMLITHHTVIYEQLPCKLVFAEWDSELLKNTSFKNNTTLDTSIASTITTIQRPKPALEPEEIKKVENKENLLDKSHHSDIVSPNSSNTNTDESSV